jgi:hypothetical protein
MTNHLWQSTLFTLAAALVAVAFRRNRAQVRYWLWLSASLKFLIPFAALMTLGGQLHWTSAAKIAPPSVSFAIEQAAQPFPETIAFAPAIAPSRDWIPIALLAGWALGLAAIAGIRFRSWLRIRAAIRASSPLDIASPIEIRSSRVS